MHSETVGRAVSAAGETGAPGRNGGVPRLAASADPRLDALATAVVQLRADLDVFPAELRDRRTAEDQLDALAVMVRARVPDVPALRQALLLVSAALGSVSALAVPLAGLRNAVELFGTPPR
ncbi:DUF5955 family protein [Streptomyces axinellae]|uniref:DUF5955 family protein n=1 Tax=Streptomyces axinellae TaxID=552788 RepID=UPI0031CE1017